MDTTFKYIKMCEKAQGIQELKKLDYSYKQGDFYIQLSIDHQSIRVVDGSEDDLPEKIRQRQIWLPRQDQLQEIHPIDLVMGILGNSWSDEMGFDKEDERLEKYLSLFKTNEQVHLAFIMKEKYNKIWNEEQQDWVQL